MITPTLPIGISNLSELDSLTRKLWAKTQPQPKSLWHHMLDAGCCALHLVADARFRSGVAHVASLFSLTCEEAKRLIAYCAACHDGYGKANPCFQKKSCELARPFEEAKLISKFDKERDYRHERYGAQCFRVVAKQSGLPRRIAEVIASTIELHHQGKRVEKPVLPKAHPEIWQAMGDQLHDAIIQVFQPPLDRLTACAHCSAAVMLLLPVVILSDWLASSEVFSELSEEQTDAEYLAFAYALAQRVVREAGFAVETPFPVVRSYCQLWPTFTEKALRPVQRTMLCDAVPDAGLTIIEAPMGEGKTEAGAFQAARLCSLWQKQGVYFALPTAATSNQMHARIEEMLGALHLGGARLMHGMAWLAGASPQQTTFDEEGERQALCDWLRPLRRAMLAESAVGTVDQAMMAAMPVRYGCLRLLGLIGKVLVIDEIHAYDAYMNTIIKCLLAWCRALQIPVVLLSATLTLAKRKELVESYGGELVNPSDAYPLVTQVCGANTIEHPVNGCAKQNTYQFQPLALWQDDEALARHALDRVGEGGCLCVLVNTVAKAQTVYRALCRIAPPEVKLLLFHARFKAAKRDEIEKHCVRLFGKADEQRPRRAILVCTQVVEQSLDLDFDGMITQLAPIDLLLQRAGRVHRHERGERPPALREARIEVLVPTSEDYGVCSAIYAPWLLSQTHKLLPQTVRVPQDMRRVIETVYQTPEEDIPKEWKELMTANKSMEAQANKKSFEPDENTFFTWNDCVANFGMEEPEEGVVASTRLGDCSLRVALLSSEVIEQIQRAPRDAALARMVFQNSMTIHESPPKDALPGGVYEGTGLCKHLWLIDEQALPVTLGRTRLDYDESLGAVTERMRCE